MAFPLNVSEAINESTWMNVTTPLCGDMFIAFQYRDIRILYKEVSDEVGRKKWNDALKKDNLGTRGKGKRKVIVLSGSILPIYNKLFQNNSLGNAPHLVRIKTKERKDDSVRDVNIVGFRVTGGLHGREHTV